MKIHVEIMETPDAKGMCDSHMVVLVDDDLFELAEKKAIEKGLTTKSNIFNIEVAHIVP